MLRDRSQVVTTVEARTVDVMRKHEVEASLGNGAIASVELYEGDTRYWVSLGSDAFTGTFTGAVRLQEACGFYTADLDCLERLGYVLLAVAEKARDGQLPEQLAVNLAAASSREARRVRGDRQGKRGRRS